MPPRWARPVFAVVISSAVAGAATAPVAAAHFNRIADYGLVANLLSVPLMGTVVMPAAVLAAVLAPFGLGWVGLAIMRPPIAWILGVADRVGGPRGR
ncbi:MAG: ComEC/Rec2 family competence protein [Paracoccaceae bacterium]